MVLNTAAVAATANSGIAYSKGEPKLQFYKFQ
jgi:hypothetical protein